MNTIDEKEAKTKWCPFAMVYDPDGASVNRYALLNHRKIAEGSECIGSECMAWRNEENKKINTCPCVDRKLKIEPERPSYIPQSWIFVPYTEHSPLYIVYAHWEESNDDILNRKEGYCGMMGRP